FSIEGPSKTDLSCHDNEDGTADVTYIPKGPGEYAVHILYKDEDILDSPFMVNIAPCPYGVDASQVRCYGTGLSKNEVSRGQRCEFAVDTSLAGKEEVNVWAVDSNLNVIDIKREGRSATLHTFSYLPLKATRHTVFVTYGGASVPDSPFKVGCL
ncbi:unnamed protein product, partial [Soboliphyme baturini]|uniref:Filamin A, alpha (actin binding protein 280) n=1 Tax=Soboliphyme baturini TaxID=241478 RepID=A0A183J6A5_9BILA